MVVSVVGSDIVVLEDSVATDLNILFNESFLLNRLMFALKCVSTHSRIRMITLSLHQWRFMLLAQNRNLLMPPFQLLLR